MSALAQDLGKIKTFEQLLPYLEAELDWPLEDYGFDELTFEYAPEEHWGSRRRKRPRSAPSTSFARCRAASRGAFSSSSSSARSCRWWCCDGF